MPSLLRRPFYGFRFHEILAKPSLGKWEDRPDSTWAKPGKHRGFRPTMDIDLAGRAHNSLVHIAEIIDRRLQAAL